MRYRVLIFIIFLFKYQTSFLQTYTWTGAGNNVSLYQEDNWEFNGAPITQINPNTPLNFNLLVNTGNIGGTGGFNGNFLLGGHSLKVYGGNINGNNNIGSFLSNTTKSELYVLGGSISCNAFNNLNVLLDNDADISLSTTNGPLEGTTLNMGIDFQGSITLSNTSIDNVRSNELTKFTVNQNIAIEGVNISLTSVSNGTTIRVINPNSNNGNKDYNDTPISNNGPNIIYILLDDLGYGDLGSLWQNQKTGDKKMLTPHLDNFAKEGATLTNHYASAPVCAPSRASFLDGLHQGHSSIRNNQFDKPIKKGLTIANMLSKAGYRTMHIGKYGTAGGRTSGTPSHPLKVGFDQYYGFLYHNQGHIHYPQNGTTNKVSFFTDGYKKILEGTELTYTTDVFTAKSKQWITNHESKRPDQPFFLYLAYDVPHSALEVPTQAYPSGSGLTGGLQWTSKTSDTPWVNTASGNRNSFIHPDYASKNWTDIEKKYATMVRRVDNAINDIIQLLKDLHIDKETMIVFTSDNGAHVTGGYNPQSFQSYANFNGVKRDLWEGGIKMPTLCLYPETILGDTIIDIPSGQWDWYATFSELAGVPIPIYTDGVSLVPSLINDKKNQVDKGYLYHEYANSGRTPNYSDFDPSKRNRRRNQMQVIRIGDYKGIRYNVRTHSDPFEIYNVITDPKETVNLSSSMPELEQKMRNKVLQVRKKDNSAIRPYDNELIPSITEGSFVNGLSKTTYTTNLKWVPNFDYLTPENSSTSNNIDTNNGEEKSNFGLSYKGFIDIPEDGVYTFYLQSSSKCHIMLHDIHLLDNDFDYTSFEISETISLKSGKHPIRIDYQQNDKFVPNIDLKIEGPGLPKGAISNSMFFRDNTTLTIKDNSLLNSVKVYPQPTKNKLNIEFLNNESNSYTFTIYTLLGQKVYEKQTQINSKNNTFVIDINDLNQGMYLLKSISKNDKSFVKKFLKE